MNLEPNERRLKSSWVLKVSLSLLCCLCLIIGSFYILFGNVFIQINTKTPHQISQISYTEEAPAELHMRSSNVSASLVQMPLSNIRIHIDSPSTLQIFSVQINKKIYNVSEVLSLFSFQGAMAKIVQDETNSTKYLTFVQTDSTMIMETQTLPLRTERWIPFFILSLLGSAGISALIFFFFPIIQYCDELNCLKKIDFLCEKLKREEFLFIVLFLLILTYGYLSIGFFDAIDNKMFLSPGILALKGYIAQGRWTPIFYGILFPNFTALPFFFMVLGCGLLTLSLWILLRALQVDAITKLSITFVFLTFPSLAYIAIYTFGNAASVTAGTLMAILAFYIYKQTEKRKERNIFRYGIIVILLAVSMGVYESMPLVFLTLFLLKMLLAESLPPIKKLVIAFFKLILLLGFSLILFKLIVIFLRKITLTAASYYTDAFVKNTYGTWSEIQESIVRSIITLYYPFEILPFDYSGIIFLILAPAALYLLLWRAQKGKRFLTTLLFGLFMISPFLLGIVLGIQQPYRASTAYVFMVVGLLAIISVKFPHRCIRIILLLVSIILALKSAFYVNQMCYAAKITENYNRVTADKIVNFIYDQKALDLPVAFVGSLDLAFPLERPETFSGASAFSCSWYSGSPYLQTNGHPNIQTIPKEMQALADRIAETMPKWPNPGCMKISDGMVVVKFGSPIPRGH